MMCKSGHHHDIWPQCLGLMKSVGIPAFIKHVHSDCSACDVLLAIHLLLHAWSVRWTRIYSYLCCTVASAGSGHGSQHLAVDVVHVLSE